MLRAVLRSALVAFCGGLILGSAAAQAKAPPAADSFYQEGRQALQKGLYPEALTQFKRALALAGDDELARWQILLAVALTYERSGEGAYAVDYYERFVRRATDRPEAREAPWAERLEVARQSIAGLGATLRTTHGVLRVVTRPADAQVLVDDAPAGADGNLSTPCDLVLAAGKHDLALRVAGHQPLAQTEWVRAGEARVIELQLVPEVPGPGPEGPEDGVPRWPGWSLLGGGSALVVTGAILYGMAWAERDTVALRAKQGPESAYDVARGDARAYEAVGWVLAGVGLAAIAGGVAWVTLVPEGTAEVDLAPTPGGVSLKLGGRF